MRFEVDWTGAKVDPGFKRVVPTLGRLVAKRVPKSRGKYASVTFVRSPNMRSLNRIYRGKDKVTDVLSFPTDDGAQFPNADKDFSGDIILCLPYIRASAEEQGVPLKEELARMFVHGSMHLLGYDHMKPKEAAKMLPLQEKIIRDL